MVHESSGNAGRWQAEGDTERPDRLWDRRHVRWTVINAIVAIPLTCLVAEYAEPPHHYFWYSVIFCSVLLMPWITWEDKGKD